MSVDYAKVFAEYTEPRTPGAVLRCFSDIAPKPLRWLWPERIPLGKLTLLIGDPGLGKSLLTADIASRVTRGTSFPDGVTCELGSVILLSAEDDAADTIRPRLDAAGADVSRVHILEAVSIQLTDGSLTEKTFNLETDVAALEAALQEHPDVRLLVIDPISAYLGGVDSHSNSEVRGVLARLAALAAQYNVAVLCVTHLRKSAGVAVYRAIASIAFTAAARAVWAVASDPEDVERRLLLAVKQNLSANPGGLAFRIEMTHNNVARLAWEPGAVVLAANDVLGNVDVQQDQSERREAREWLVDFLADGPVAVKRIQDGAKAAGLSWMTVRRAKEGLAVAARKSGYQGKWEWRLEDAQPIETQVSTFEQVIRNANVNGNNAPKDAQPSKVNTLDPAILETVRNRPATCSPDCYELEPHVWIHRPSTGCRTISGEAS
jgi:archaellum biogenesis ATPase FlaH